jgi:hypothetical protein
MESVDGGALSSTPDTLEEILAASLDIDMTYGIDRRKNDEKCHATVNNNYKPIPLPKFVERSGGEKRRCQNEFEKV